MDVLVAVFLSAIIGGAIAAFLAFATPFGAYLRNPWAMLISFGLSVVAVFVALTTVWSA
jgi:hypothetical protein